MYTDNIFLSSFLDNIHMVIYYYTNCFCELHFRISKMATLLNYIKKICKSELFQLSTTALLTFFFLFFVNNKTFA